MSRQRFTPEQQNKLRENPYIYSVTITRITLTKEFKELFWVAFQGGDDPRSILLNYDFDINLLGDSRIRSISTHLREEYMAYGEFHQGYQKCKQISSDVLSEEASDTLSSDRTQLKKLQHEVDYLKQEIEFLNKFPRSEIRGSRCIAHE